LFSITIYKNKEKNEIKIGSDQKLKEKIICTFFIGENSKTILQRVAQAAVLT